MNTKLNSIKLPSKAQIGDDVDIVFDETKSFKGCTVLAVKFEESTIYYDIMVPIGLENDCTLIKDIPSAFVYTLQDSPLNEIPQIQKIELQTDDELDKYSNALAADLDLNERDTKLAATHIRLGMLKIRENIRNQMN